MRLPSRETLRIRSGFLVLQRNTKWKCGHLERLIIDYLKRKYPCKVPAEEVIKHILESYGPFKGKIVYSLWNRGIKLAEKYGPKKGRLVREVIEAINRLERRFIIKVED